jgi:hypothetical protein
MTLQAFYDSAYQQPLLLGLPGLAWVIYLLFRRDVKSALWRYCGCFALLSILDSWLTANEVFGIGPLGGAAATIIPIVFVIVGDLRVYLWMFREKWIKAILLSLVVPIASQLVMKALPAAWGENPRIVFLVYEIGFVAFFGTLMAIMERLDRVSLYVLTYYSLWSFADLWLLASGSPSSPAWGIRVIANLLYYVGWTPWVYFFSGSAEDRRATCGTRAAARPRREPAHP